MTSAPAAPASRTWQLLSAIGEGPTPFAKRVYRRLRRFWRQPTAPRTTYRSETSKVRHLVLPYCQGHGCDIGFGGDKILKHACDGIDLPTPYAATGQDRIDIPCRVGHEPIPVADRTYDYVYSSHLIEDFADTSAILAEFCRLVRPGGNLVLVFPDQPRFEAHCRATGQPLNPHHVHATMGREFMVQAVRKLRDHRLTLVFSSDCEIDYNVVMVYRVDTQVG
jgi:SAM-dependent methyltransferase